MTDDMEDPVTRETMALEWIVESWHSHPPEFTSPPTMDEVRQMLQVLDSFDPLRAMLPEVVKALEAARTEFFDVLASCDAERVHHDGDEFHERLGRIESALSKLRKLTPTEGRDGR